MPCLDEAETLEVCICKAKAAMEAGGVPGEVLVADNGSTDGSQQIARRNGARVIDVPVRGYGAALQGGITAARGRFIIMGDADDSYDFGNLMPFVEKLREGYDLVMGNRFLGGIEPGAMPPLHRYLGNPVLTGIGRLLFRSPSGDFHCGLRGFQRESALALGLQTTGMEFASEMVVKATLMKQRIAEVPTTLAPDGRSRAPHLRSWRDGWRHLRFLMLYSPRWLFLYPGLVLMAIGLAAMLALIPSAVLIGTFAFDVNTMLYAAAAIFVGYQSAIFAVFTKVYGVSEGLLPPDQRLNRLFGRVKLETGLVAGLLLVAFGAAASIWALADWGAQSFGDLDPQQTLRLIVPAVLSLTLGFQTILSSFFLSVLGLGRQRDGAAVD
ncbi:MAG: glycosyltransferase family 2 protein [Myxococcota bacterium]|nr:glycosyltransferase family 2 protein [Myxococcota bacterium]